MTILTIEERDAKLSTIADANRELLNDVYETLDLLLTTKSENTEVGIATMSMIVALYAKISSNTKDQNLSLIEVLLADIVGGING